MIRTVPLFFRWYWHYILDFCTPRHLKKNSSEYLQLEAMGYEIQPTKPSDIITIVKSMGSRLVVNKAENGISVGRYFTRERKNLNQGAQFQLLKLLSDINTEEQLQFSGQDTFLTVAACYSGPYNQGCLLVSFASLKRYPVFSTNIREYSNS